MDNPVNANDYGLFSIKKAALACNLSHSSLIRLEERKMLVPARTNSVTEYRYYDNHNITRILQIRRLHVQCF